MTPEEYLALPEEKPYLEYIDGRVEQKPMVNAAHRSLVRRLDALFDRYIESHGGDAGPEGRVALFGSGQFRLPDTAYWAPGVPSGDDSAPTVAVEVRSPGQPLEALRDKCRAFLAAGAQSCWLIDPDARSVEIFDADAPPRLLGTGGMLTTPAMPGFEANLDALFALLDEPVT